MKFTIEPGTSADIDELEKLESRTCQHSGNQSVYKLHL